MIGPTFGSSYCQGQVAKEKLILLMNVIKDKGVGAWGSQDNYPKYVICVEKSICESSLLKYIRLNFRCS